MKSTTVNTTPEIPEGERLVTRKWAADRLQVSVETLKRWEKRGLIPPRLVGLKLIRYSLADVETLAKGLG